MKVGDFETYPDGRVHAAGGDTLDAAVYPEFVRNLHAAHERGRVIVLEPGQKCWVDVAENVLRIGDSQASPEVQPLPTTDVIRQPRVYSTPLDPGISRAVEVLQDAGIETFESCEGGNGHAYPEPTVRFHGERAEGFRALAVAMSCGLPVSELRRTWPVQDGEPTGPWWELTFRVKH